MDGIGEIVFFRKPKPPGKVVKSPDTRGIADHESREDGEKIVLLQGRSPGSKRRDFELHGKQVRAQHIRRKPRLWTEDRITILHELSDRREVEVPELLHDFPSGGIKGSISIWIILTKLRQNTVLIGGMTANINRFQNVHLQSRANLYLN